MNCNGDDSVEVTLSLPVDIWETLDKRARDLGITRDKLLTRLIMEAAENE